MKLTMKFNIDWQHEVKSNLKRTKSSNYFREFVVINDFPEQDPDRMVDGKT